MADAGAEVRSGAATGRATAYWTTPTGGELRAERLPPPGPGQAEVRTLRSGVSGGSERLVHDGQVPPAVTELMRAPFQEGQFGGPVKYGYLSVGVVERLGSDVQGENLLGRRVFCHYPHQDRYVVPLEALTVVPDEVPSSRAVLAGTMETALNAVWDARPLYADRVAVIGIGLIGASVLSLLQRFPLTRLVAVDPDPQARAVAQAWGVQGLHPEQMDGELDLVLHCSGTAAGLATSLAVLGDEGRVIELSWYGQHDPSVPLGAQFHARRLSIQASQVSVVSGNVRSRTGRRERLALALQTLADVRYDQLLSGSSPFSSLPVTMERLMTSSRSTWCHVVNYPNPPGAGPHCEER